MIFTNTIAGNNSNDSNHSINSTVSKALSARPLKVLFVQRTKNRVILNMDELTAIADAMGLDWCAYVHGIMMFLFIDDNYAIIVGCFALI